MNEIKDQVFLSVMLKAPDKPKVELPLWSIPSMWIIEDMDMVVPCCSLIYAETVSELSELLPLVGNEQIEINIGKTKDDYRTWKFKYFSYKTSNASSGDSRYKEIVSNWIDPDFTPFNDYPVEKSFPKTRNSDVANKLLSGMKTSIEPSDNSYDHFFPNIIRGKALKELCKKTYSNGSSYVFYKNRDTYKFESRNKMFRGTSKYNYAWGYTAWDFQLFGNNRSAFTNVKSDLSGYSYDTGKLINKSHTPQSVKSKKVRLGHHSPFGDKTDVNVNYMYTGTRSEMEVDASAINAVDTFMDAAFKCSFLIYGNYDISAGDLIKLVLQSSDKKSVIHNMVSSGLWLVKKIVHFYGGRNYWCKLYCVSNAAEDLDRRLKL